MSLPRPTWIPAAQPTSLNQPPTQLTIAIFTILIFHLSFHPLDLKREEEKVEMAPLQIKLSSFPAGLSLKPLSPALYRSDSASSFASAASSARSVQETELQPWKYGHKRAYSEQDEVKRKRAELAEKRRRASDAAWREFWP